MNDPGELKDESVKKYKIVIKRRDGIVIKGYFCSDAPSDFNLMTGNLESTFHELLSKCISESGAPLDVDWPQLKAVFFVSSFAGDREQQNVRFYTNGPEVNSIWAEIVFSDGEVIEGCIQNSLDHLENDGFFLRPSTPRSNNLLIYVNKAAIVSYRVLGVRTLGN
jgi:hypothetical protein